MGGKIKYKIKKKTNIILFVLSFFSLLKLYFDNFHRDTRLEL